MFNFKLEDNDPMILALEIKAIMHDIIVVGGKVDFALKDYLIKALLDTYSHYLESLQASGNAKPSHLILWWTRLLMVRKLSGRR